MSRFGTGMAERVLRRLGLEPWPDSGNSPALVDELNRMRAENDELRRIATTERSEYDECEAELMATAKRADQLEAEVERLREELERLRAERLWVPVGERPPYGQDYEKRFLVVVSRGTQRCIVPRTYIGGGHWNRLYGDEVITHWQPLPPLPEDACE